MTNQKNFKDLSEKELQDYILIIKKNRITRVDSLLDLVFVSKFQNKIMKTSIIRKLQSFRKDYLETTIEDISVLDSVLNTYESEFCIYESD